MIERRWFQTEAKAAVFDYFNSGKRGNPLVQMPTGTGKSVVIAQIVREAFEAMPHLRVMMLTHVKELIQQNYDRLLEVWPHAPVGVYSAGLKQRDGAMPIVFGGVQSVANRIKKSLRDDDATGIPRELRHFGFRHLLFIDECHLLSPDNESMYQFVIKHLKTVNPFLQIVGFTATGYRMKQGRLIDDGLFTDVAYDLTSVASFNRLIDEGYLAPLYPKRTDTQIDLSGVKLTAGEFNMASADAVIDQESITYSAVKECVEKAYDRNAWLFFASSVNHSEHIAAMLRHFGVAAQASHSQLDDDENARRIGDFKSGKLRALVNMNKLTTGFDHPPIDFIGMLRPTMSPGLHVQMLGRGTRPSRDTGKRDCLCLDFAGNARRLGPINDPVLPRKPGEGGGGDVPIRICNACGTYCYAAATVCPCCGFVFPQFTKLAPTAGDDILMRLDAPQIETFDVTHIEYLLHSKPDKPPSLRVQYYCGMLRYEKFIGLEHKGRHLHESREWFRMMQPDSATEMPMTTHELYGMHRKLRKPKRIKVHVVPPPNYSEILGYEF